MLGDISFVTKDYKQCDKYYDKALSYTPHNIVLLNNYAYYLSLRSSKLRKALKMSAYTIAKDSTNATYLDTYAWILYQQKKYEQAKQVLRKAIMQNGNHEATILEHYGDVLFKLGDKDSARIYWKRSYEAGNRSKELLHKVGE